VSAAASGEHPQSHGDPADPLHQWMRDILAKEVWFVDPPHHVPKPNDAVAVGVLSHFGYSFSMVALGHLSLYHRLNRDPECPAIADRVFVYDPLAGPDGELAPDLTLSRPLTTLERKIPLCDLDLVCISLTNPDAVTTALNLLRLGGVPIRRVDRKKGAYPLILAGGPGCCNPEPFADYFDLFCIGDGCTLTAQIVSAIYKLRCWGERLAAESIHAVLGNVAGLYVPSLYRIDYSASSVALIESALGPKLVEPAADPPEEWAQASLMSDGKVAVIVPNYGCKHRCAYCQISEVSYEQFSAGPLLQRVEQYLSRGISTLIVNSATLTQHTEVGYLLSGIADRVEAAGGSAKVYIGSVRFDELSDDVLSQIGRLKAFSHTYLLYTNGSPVKFMALAPEHGSRDLMRRMYRPVDPWRILDTAQMAARHGVNHFVLYFIVGFEAETHEDRDQISALTAALLDMIHDTGGRIIMKINPLIPTPGTACQRMAMPSIDEYRRYVREVTNGIVDRVGAKRYAEQVEVVLLPEKRLVIEAIINRADRRVGALVEQLAERRARGDEPSEKVLKEWLIECGLSWEHLVSSRAAREILPWQVVDRTSARSERRVLISIRARADSWKMSES